MDITPLEALAMVGAGAIGGVVAGLVTERLHNGQTFWSRRIGRTRFRYANLPVGGAVAFTVAAFLPYPGTWIAVSAGLAMLTVAVGWAWVDPA